MAPAQKRYNIVDLNRIKTVCAECSLRQLCLPVGIPTYDFDKVDRFVKQRRVLARGEALFDAGDAFRSLFVVRSGSLKSFIVSHQGEEQVVGFHLPGEFTGMDAVATGHHGCTTQALETTNVCEIPFIQLEQLAHEIPTVQHQLFRIMSKEIMQHEQMMMSLGRSTAEQRFAAFLMGLSSRFQERGFSPREFQLSMSRRDIANYLGLALETVSRFFSHFQRQGWLVVERKHVILKDMNAIQALLGPVMNVDVSRKCHA